MDYYGHRESCFYCHRCSQKPLLMAEAILIESFAPVMRLKDIPHAIVNGLQHFP